MEARPTVLLVDDEESVQKVLTYPLEREGYRVVQARDGEEALERYRAEPVDLVILDLMLPRLDGLAVCRRLREERSAVPIIMLTARGDEGDKVLGLELGADDYITKPFSIREFMSRVRALLRRAQLPPSSGRDEVIEVERAPDRHGPAHASRREERRSQLTYLEFELLRMLATNPGRVFTRKALLDELWGGSEFRDPRTIDVHVRHLREKIEQDPERARADLHGARRRLPIPRRAMRRPPLISLSVKVGLVLFAVVAGALAIVYIAVVPQLENRLVDAKIRRARAGGAQRSPSTCASLDYLAMQTMSCGRRARASARASIVLERLTDDQLRNVADSRDSRARRLLDGPVRARGGAHAAASRRAGASTTGSRTPSPRIPPTAGLVVLLAAPLDDVLANVGLIRRSLLVAGAASLVDLLAGGVPARLERSRAGSGGSRLPPSGSPTAISRRPVVDARP